MSTIHLLGLSHLPTRAEFTCCAYTQKIRKLARMLMSRGHRVVFYGVEGSDVECTEFVQVLSEEARLACYGQYDWTREFFRHSGTDAAAQAFNANAIWAINARKQPRDFLFCTMGNYQKPIADNCGLRLTVECGIGYEGIFAEFRIFESYAWMHYLYGKTGATNGLWYDCVIPNYFDPAEFPLGRHSGDYFLFVGRLTQRKGLDVAVQVTRILGKKLIVAGQGSLVSPQERLNITDPHVEHIGVVGPAERARLMGDAIACFVPTYYIEPFGGVAVEAQLCGTPVITTDWGVFPETVVHGVTGFRCRTLDDFLFAARQCLTAEHFGASDDFGIRGRALRNYSMTRCAAMYDEYLFKLQDLFAAGWPERHDNRQQLDWLTKV